MSNLLPRNLRFLLHSNKMTAAELADRLGVTPQAASKWLKTDEDKLKNISVQNLVAISELFGVSVDQLLKADLAKQEDVETAPDSVADKVEDAFQALKALRDEIKKKPVNVGRVIDFIRNYADPINVNSFAR